MGKKAKLYSSTFHGPFNLITSTSFSLILFSFIQCGIVFTTLLNIFHLFTYLVFRVVNRKKKILVFKLPTSSWWQSIMYVCSTLHYCIRVYNVLQDFSRHSGNLDNNKNNFSTTSLWSIKLKKKKKNLPKKSLITQYQNYLLCGYTKSYCSYSSYVKCGIGHPSSSLTKS